MQGSFHTFAKYLFSILIILTISNSPKLALAQGPINPVELEAFFDQEISFILEAKHIAGMTIVVVQNGDILFRKGYGYADVGQGIAVDPETTLFRMGSSSKLFVWTAVMQLAEQGKLDLDADINTYLDFQVPATYSEPITMKHLLAHAAGFEDRNYATRARTPEDIVPLGEWLKTHIPARVRPPGAFTAYSNYGTALAGYIVARVSGMSYEDYVAQYILQPLDMAHTSPYQPLPAELATDMAQGYQFIDGDYMPQDFELYNIAPAGASSTTATDIARFMIAHLQDGRYGEKRLLEEATAQQMHSRLFSHDSRINGMAYGFAEMDQSGQRIIGHGGDTNLFHTQMALLPDQDIGFFAACNSAECDGVPKSLFTAFVAHHFPMAHDPDTSSPTADFATRADLVAGTYRLNRISHTTAEKILSLTTVYTFRVQQDGTLTVAGKGWTFVEAAPFVFRQTNGPRTLVFRQGEKGPATHAFLSSTPYAALERVPKSANMLLHLTILGVSILLFLSLFIGGSVTFLVRRKQRKDTHPQLAQVSRWVLAGVAVMCIFFLLLFVLAVPGDSLMMGTIPLSNLSPIVFVLMIVLALATLVFTFLAWRNRYWSLFGRIHYTLVTLSAWAFIWFSNYWCMMRW